VKVTKASATTPGKISPTRTRSVMLAHPCVAGDGRGDGRRPESVAWRGGEEKLFERFTDRARRVVVLAQEEARLLNHNYVGTEHLLLGLIHEAEGVAAKALESLGISLEGVRAQVEEIIGQGQSAPTARIPSPRGPRRSWSCRCARPSSWATTCTARSSACGSCLAGTGSRRTAGRQRPPEPTTHSGEPDRQAPSVVRRASPNRRPDWLMLHLPAPA
jgi:Clp amino terminal domain, pathogenicity island component